MTIKAVTCPSCSAQVEWSSQSRFRPFCSERCKMKDLGAWATERYKVPEPQKSSQDQEVQPRDS